MQHSLFIHRHVQPLWEPSQLHWTRPPMMSPLLPLHARCFNISIQETLGEQLIFRLSHSLGDLSPTLGSDQHTCKQHLHLSVQPASGPTLLKCLSSSSLGGQTKPPQITNPESFKLPSATPPVIYSHPLPIPFLGTVTVLPVSERTRIPYLPASSALLPCLHLLQASDLLRGPLICHGVPEPPCVLK